MRNKFLRLFTVLTLVAQFTFFFSPSLGTATLTLGYESHKAPFSLQVKNQTIAYKTFGIFVLPGEKLKIDVVKPVEGIKYDMATTVEGWIPSAAHSWSWKAPKKAGVYPVKIESSPESGSITLNVFVMVPATKGKNGVLNGYKIGTYPKKTLKNNPIYQAPIGFVEITPENRHVQVSPHFRLAQFICKQKGNYPKYIVLREPLLMKLETLLEKVNEKGLECASFHVMSGYRTPYYNKSIGNVAYSRHQWGDAADIFIDQNPQDGIMDDVNADGKVDQSDCVFLSQLINDIHSHSHNKELLGGFGTYKSTKSHGPFVHIDARGTVKTW